MWDFSLKSFLNDITSNKIRPPAQHKMCDVPGCDQTGEHRAPKSRESINQYFFFCLDHVREYNSKWDYFKGMSAAEIQSQMHNSTTWDRPTWRTTKGATYEDRIKEKIYTYFSTDGVAGGFRLDGEEEKVEIRMSTLPEPVSEALSLLNVKPPVIWDDIRNNYKALTKQYHPDANVGDKEAEEKFKKITLAYNILKLSYKDYLQLDEK